MLRSPNCLDNRLTDGGKVVSPMQRPRSTPQKHYFSTSWYSLLLEAEWAPGPSAGFTASAYLIKWNKWNNFFLPFLLVYLLPFAFTAFPSLLFAPPIVVPLSALCITLNISLISVLPFLYSFPTNCICPSYCYSCLHILASVRQVSPRQEANWVLFTYRWSSDRLCGLVVRVLGYRSGGPGSIPGTTKKKVVGLERGSLSLVSTTEELLDRKVAAPV
jgi:hypothetical protein